MVRSRHRSLFLFLFFFSDSKIIIFQFGVPRVNGGSSRRPCKILSFISISRLMSCSFLFLFWFHDPSIFQISQWIIQWSFLFYFFSKFKLEAKQIDIEEVIFDLWTCHEMIMAFFISQNFKFLRWLHRATHHHLFIAIEIFLWSKIHLKTVLKFHHGRIQYSYSRTVSSLIFASRINWISFAVAPGFVNSSE